MAKKKKKIKNFVSQGQKVNFAQKEESIEDLLSEEEISVEEELPVFVEDSLEELEDDIEDVDKTQEEPPKEKERRRLELDLDRKEETNQIVETKKEVIQKQEEPRERQRLSLELDRKDATKELLVNNEKVIEKQEEPRERKRLSLDLDRKDEIKESLVNNEKASEKQEEPKEKVGLDKKQKTDQTADSKEEEPKEKIELDKEQKTDQKADSKKEEPKEKVKLNKEQKTDQETDKKNIPSEEKVLEIKNLKTFFYTDEGVVKSVNDVSYYVKKGETLGVVGESGCGKSVTAMSILRLIPQPPGKIVGGEILFKGRDLTKISDEEMRHIRGNRIAMIFQEPMTSLNPVYTVGDQIIEAICLHMDKTYTEARAMALSMLEKVGIPAPANRIDEYPHQMSGGMKQRVMIAMALVCNPELLIADEPTTALDVTIQAQILELLVKLQKDFGTSIIMITHDLGVIAEIAHRVVVMYASKIVETAEVKELFANPKHPYTIGLFNSIPKLDTSDRLIPIKGMVPNPLDFPVGCKFNNRCEFATEKCRKSEPTLKEISPGHWSACWLNEK